MSNDFSTKRVKKLFSGIQQLADSEPPNGNGHAEAKRRSVEASSMQFHDPTMLAEEVEALRARVAEL